MQIKSWDYELAMGDTQKMKKLYAYWKKVANERIKVTATPKHMKAAQAYKHMVEPLLGASYVGQNKKGQVVFRAIPKTASAREIREAFRKLTDFLGARTSTVAGIKAVAKERMDNIRDVAKIPLTNSQAESLLRFLGSPEGVEAKKNFDSEQVVRAVSLDLKKNPKLSGVDQVIERWHEWEEKQSTLADWIRENEGEIFESF